MLGKVGRFHIYSLSGLAIDFNFLILASQRNNKTSPSGGIGGEIVEECRSAGNRVAYG